MINSIIWFLTDIDFSEEWESSSFFRKLDLIYTTIGLLSIEVFNFLFFLNILKNIINCIFS